MRSLDSSEVEDSEMEDLISGILDDEGHEGSDSDGSGEATDFEAEPQVHGDVPVIYPRTRFTGHCNAATVKDGECSEPETSYSLSAN